VSAGGLGLPSIVCSINQAAPLAYEDLCEARCMRPRSLCLWAHHAARVVLAVLVLLLIVGSLWR
jgi:hypothetical protein